MHEYKRTVTLPTLHVTLPCAPSQEIICIGGGRAPETGWLTGLIQQRNMCGSGTPIWAIDRGVNICHSANQVPTHLIGDGDSANPTAWRWAEEQNTEIHTFPPEKDFTDTELALQIAADQYTHPLVILTAAFGGRLDHLMSTAAVAAHADIPCVLADERETLLYLRDGETIHITCETFPRAISLLPFTEECTGVTTEGLYWELADAQIGSRTSLAVSNVLAPENSAKTFTISIARGVLGVYLCHIE